MEKSSLRERFRGEVAQLPPDLREQQSQKIFERLRDFFAQRAGETWSLFSPLVDEPNLLKCISDLKTIRWVFPKVVASGVLEFYQVKNLVDMKPNAWGLLQPDPEKSQPLNLQKIDGFIIPALAYDSSGVRLGRGGGYYDQTLQQCKGLRIGVIFENGFSSVPLPKETHDQSVDYVVTPKTWIQVKG